MNLGIGAVHIAFDASLVWTVLGSCVAVILHAPAARASAICHAQLPASTARETRCDVGCPHPCTRQGAPANDLKYATCCVEYMVTQLGQRGIASSHLRSAIIGGADVLRNVISLPIGLSNVEAARRTLTAHRVRVDFEDVGGRRGRTLTYATATGELTLRHVRQGT